MCRLADTRTHCDGATLRSPIRRSREIRVLVSAGGRSLLVARAGRVRVLLDDDGRATNSVGAEEQLGPSCRDTQHLQPTVGAAAVAAAALRRAAYRRAGVSTRTS